MECRHALMAMAVPFMIAAGASAGEDQFIQRTTTYLPSSPDEYSNQLTSADLDNDGDLDIIVANGQGYASQGASLKVRIFMNKINEADNAFVDETDDRIPNTTGWFRGVEMGDYDNDGDLDMVLANDFFKRPKLMVNDGNGFFESAPSNVMPQFSLSSARAQFADVDNDGDLDLFFCHSGTSSRFSSNGAPKLYLNEGDGTFIDGTANLPAGNIPDQQDCIFADVDGDFDLDVHIGSRDGVSKLWLNDGTGIFTNSPIPGGGATYSYDFGDIDDDGDMDLISIQGSTDLLLENNMPDPWANISNRISPNTPIDDNDSKFFDYDNDGDLDYVVGSLGSRERVYRNNGPGSNPLFTEVFGIMPTGGDSTLDIEVADYDDDGTLDIFTAQGESGNFQNKIYMNENGPADTIAPEFKQLEQAEDVAFPDGPTSDLVVVRAVITDAHSSDRGFYPGPINLHYGNGGKEVVVPMQWVGNSMWRGVIDLGLSGFGTVEYYVTAEDRNGNLGTSETLSFEVDGGVPCETCPDFNFDGMVDGADLGLLLAAWSTSEPCLDINADGNVDGADLGLLLAAWGVCQ